MSWPAFLLFGSLFAGAAQVNSGEIAGVVRDEQGGVLPGVAVVAEHLDTGARTERVTDSEGRFLLPSLRVGVYTVTSDLPGFTRVVRPGVVVQLGQQLQVDIVLAVGGLAEEVVVTGETPLLQATTAEISDVIDNR